MINIKKNAKTAAFAVGFFIFPLKPKQQTEEFDIDAHIAAIQASFRKAIKEDLLPS
jgi:hypothetical protein